MKSLTKLRTAKALNEEEYNKASRLIRSPDPPSTLIPDSNALYEMYSTGEMTEDAFKDSKSHVFFRFE
jgi:hypothetical protein